MHFKPSRSRLLGALVSRRDAYARARSSLLRLGHFVEYEVRLIGYKS